MRNLIALAVFTLGLVVAGVYWSYSASTTPGAPIHRDPVDYSAIAALREDQMRKLVFHPVPKAVSTAGFIDETGAEMTLAAFQGQHVLLNFWATWCAPCRKEMPSLARLQTSMGGDEFQVVTLATGRNSPVAIDQFFAEQAIVELPKYRDPSSVLAREMGIAGLPISVILNPEGQEIARLRGDADWNTPSAKAILSALMAP